MAAQAGTCPGTVWNNAYSERPLVTQAADGTPLAFYVGLGRSTYLDCCAARPGTARRLPRPPPPPAGNWPMLFCTGAEGEVCGPTLRPE